jgi:hypothetical protein
MARSGADNLTMTKSRELWISACWLTLALAVVCACFVYSVHRRQPFIKQAIDAEYWPRQSAMTLSIARNWYDESPLDHGFIMYWSPRSPAQQTIQQRSPYIRFPFGAPLPVYLEARIAGTPPDLAMVVGCNLAIQLVTAILGALLAWSLLSVHRVPRVAKLLGATFAGAVYALSDITMLGHSLDYFCTEAVVPWFAAAVLLEYWRLHAPSESLVQGTVRFLLPLAVLGGCLTDWFMFIVAFVLLARRWLMRGAERPAFKSDNLALLVIPAAVIVVLMWYVASVGHFPILWAKFLQRTGLDPSLSGHARVSLLKGFYQRALGLTNSMLIWGSLLVLGLMHWSLRRLGPKVDSPNLSRFLDVASVGYLLAVPCLLHAHALSEHYSIHGDDALKFVLVIALLPYIVLPLSALLWLRALGANLSLPVVGLEANLDRDFSTSSQVMLCTAILLGLALNLLPSHGNWQGEFVDQSQKVSAADLSLARLVRAIAKPGDLCFSPNLEISDLYDDLPQTGLSRKVLNRLDEPGTLSTHPALVAARLNHADARLLLIVDRAKAPADWQVHFSSILSQHLFESPRFSVWVLKNPSEAAEVRPAGA